MTDLSKGSAMHTSEWSGQRLGGEAFVRDTTSAHNGPAVRHTRVTKADRCERSVVLPMLP